MVAVISILVAIAFLFGGTIEVLMIIVVGIHQDDRAKSLTGAPRTPIEAITRHVLGVGVRNEDASREEGED